MRLVLPHIKPQFESKEPSSYAAYILFAQKLSNLKANENITSEKQNIPTFSFQNNGAGPKLFVNIANLWNVYDQLSTLHLSCMNKTNRCQDIDST